MHFFPNAKNNRQRFVCAFLTNWRKFWMYHASFTHFGRLSMRLAAWFSPPYKGRIFLSLLSEKGFIEHTAIINHPNFKVGKHCFIGDRVIINERKDGGKIELGNQVEILRDTTLETGSGGQLIIGDHSSIHPSCHLYSYLEPIEIGCGVMIAPNCALYSYDHGFAPNEIIRKQPLQSKGPIKIGNEAWIGVSVTILSGVTIGSGAVIGAGSVVSDDVPDGAIAVGIPARVQKNRAEID
jgi:acetyltransferase-like isoleucine patch superfamily enzyme